MKNKPITFIRLNIDYFIIFFVLFYILSLGWSANVELGLIRVMKFIRNFCFYIIVRELFIRDFFNSYRKMTICFFVAGIAVSIVYLSVIFKGVSLPDIMALHEKKVLSSVDLGFWRRQGTGMGLLINGPSNFLVLSGLFLFGSVMTTKRKIIRLVNIFFSFLMLFMASLVTLNRSAMINVAAILTVLLFVNYRIRFRINTRILFRVLLVFLLIAVALGFHELVLKRFTNPFKDGSWGQRVDLASIAIKAFLQSPIIGVGAGGNFFWQSQYADYAPSRLVDNLYLTILSEVGLVGFMLFLFILFFHFKYLLSFLFNSRCDLFMRNIAVIAFAFSIGYFFIALFGQEFESFEAWLILAITSAIINKQMADCKALTREVMPCAAKFSGENNG